MATRNTGYWLDDHEDDDHENDAPGDGDALWERPRQAARTRFVPLIGIGGIARATTLAFVARLVAWCIAVGRAPLVIITNTNDHGGWESTTALRDALTDVFDSARIVGLMTECSASEGASVILNAVATELVARYPDADMLLFVGSEQSAALPLNPELTHYAVAITDTDHQADADNQLMIARADLIVMHLPSPPVALPPGESGEVVGWASGLPIVVADCTSGQGLNDAFAVLREDVLSDWRE